MPGLLRGHKAGFLAFVALLAGLLVLTQPRHVESRGRELSPFHYTLRIPRPESRYAEIELVVEGQLLAQGTSEAPIRFISDAAVPKPGEWVGIVFKSSSTPASMLDNCRPQQQFTTLPRSLSDYEPMCQFHQTSPDSPFTQRWMCTVATETGRLTLSDTSLTVTEGVEKTKITISSDAEFRELLHTYFQIVL